MTTIEDIFAAPPPVAEKYAVGDIIGDGKYRRAAQARVRALNGCVKQVLWEYQIAFTTLLVVFSACGGLRTSICMPVLRAQYCLGHFGKGWIVHDNTMEDCLTRLKSWKSLPPDQPKKLGT